MKYQVLARKYRPKTFTTMMGQEHVLKALSNALQSERLHHAYLFTGTRGVGKTTVARVLAKALNCEQGISPNPCGKCAACQEIDEGRFVDLIEVDAASRTKVEDTRELLDNVQYAPTRGRFKIYLIDEVHMLSGHSFNALLKTLEEPPPHVKFLLATTDPQKLPVTILSRCLQFNLKSLTIEQIEQQLALVLNAENISYESNVLKPLAIAADGSMRDALSLLDQAIAYSDGKPNLPDVEAMLGSVQKARIFELLIALANDDGKTLIEDSRLLSSQGIDVNTILSELISTLQRIALYQMVPDAIDDSLGDQQSIAQLAQAISAEDIQLYYQIALNGRKDLPYSPQPQSGFEMILLRMLAFKPTGGASDESDDGNSRQLKKKSSKSVNKIAPAIQATEKKIPQASVSQQLSAVEQPKQAVQAVSQMPKAVKDITQKNSTQKDSSIVPSTAPVQDNVTDYELPPIDAYNDNGQAEDNAFQEHYEQAGHLENHLEEIAPSNDQYNSVNSSAQVHTVREPKTKPSPTLEQKKPPLAAVVPLFKDVNNDTLKDKVNPETQIYQDVNSEKNAVKTEQKIPCEQPNTTGLADYWHDLINRSELNGLEQQLAKHSAMVNKSIVEGEQIFELLLDSMHKHLLNDKIKTRLLDILQPLFSIPLKIIIKECEIPVHEQQNTPRRREIYEAEVLQQEAVESIMDDPKVQLIVNAFNAKVRKESIKPIKN
ncbi:DNA polymerase III subunit gamma/tau [sulfur-oxidizing endosymbiont of Gigantopelta aegis]|uniref:DNA polymerase III subunit gamma/tau n=1 Tax=sulfur-oxidizing endosymbiont of Gigantopelta aegis TaxID=2794934 RepID=UPI0018DD2045|nr:DNA polymerase III subunit gamma/tau [sulfur-oxidizing endosymbiont of Gigantopelta aegis]